MAFAAKNLVESFHWLSGIIPESFLVVQRGWRPRGRWRFVMQKEKEPTKKLTAEELEKRVAPTALTFDTGGSDTSAGATGAKAPPKK